MQPGYSGALGAVGLHIARAPASRRGTVGMTSVRGHRIAVKAGALLACSQSDASLALTDGSMRDASGHDPDWLDP